MNDRPGITILYSAGASNGLVLALGLGCEEEGVPAVFGVRDGDASSLARRASELSISFLGIGIDSLGSIALHDQRLGGLRPLLAKADASVDHARAIGVAAGRIVRGRPVGVIRLEALWTVTE